MSQTVVADDTPMAPTQLTRLLVQPVRLRMQYKEGVGVVRRAAKQCGDAAEEFLDDTTQRHVGNLERFGMRADNIDRRKPSSFATPGGQCI
jgi:hypothetical protein